MKKQYGLEYPRRPLFLSLALAGTIALGSLFLSGVPAPAFLLGWYGAGYCDDAEAANPGAAGPCAYAAESACADAVDNDSDERTDCLDPDCQAPGVAAASGCGGLPCPRTEQDADGDCTPDYYFWGYACGDGNDNEGDGQADCNDADCASDASCRGGGCPWWDPFCDDGPVCGDGICANGESCAVDCGGAENCSDMTDNDGDGLIDCGDADCAADPRCQPESVCNDAVDNDSDGGTDCADADCAANPACDIDCDPCDALGDCYDNCTCNPSDPTCIGAVEVCDNSTDDDTDGDSDCADSDCVDDPSCDSESACDDGFDNDADGDVDCADSDCSADISCDLGCTDPNACNYGNSGSCTYDCCPDEDGDGLNDNTGESCGSGCSDSNATNYDPEAPVGGNRDESCEYEMEQRVEIPVEEILVRGPATWLLAASSGSLGDLLADGTGIQGFMVKLRVSLSKTSGGNLRFTISSQVAPETGSGQWPMGFIQAGPTLSLTKNGIVPTPPYVSDDITQMYIHQAIDRGFYGEKTAMMHSILQKTTDVWHYIHGND